MHRFKIVLIMAIVALVSLAAAGVAGVLTTGEETTVFADHRDNHGGDGDGDGDGTGNCKVTTKRAADLANVNQKGSCKIAKRADANAHLIEAAGPSSQGVGLPQVTGHVVLEGLNGTGLKNLGPGGDDRVCAISASDTLEDQVGVNPEDRVFLRIVTVDGNACIGVNIASTNNGIEFTFVDHGPIDRVPPPCDITDPDCGDDPKDPPPCDITDPNCTN